MNTYETSATVEEHGQVRLVGLPFEPGTEIEVTIREKSSAETANFEATRARMKDLFARVRARNTEPVGPLNREELYDRKVLR
ncbi:MAG: hypothetical protein ACREPW_05565 [Candidatus Binataceae bacterium]